MEKNMKLNHTAIHQKLIQCCKSTIPQLKKKIISEQALALKEVLQCGFYLNVLKQRFALPQSSFPLI